jgi:Uncharacterized membrane-associated protein/domain
MVYHVHICTVGRASAPSVAFLRLGIPVDAFWFLNSEGVKEYDDSEKEIRSALKGANIPEENIKKKKIDPYDFRGIIKEIVDIKRIEEAEHKHVKFHVNFTSGTNIMAGAACCASYYLDSELYYVRNREEDPSITAENEIIKIENPNVPEVDSIKGKTKEIFFIISRGNGVYNEDIVNEMRLAPNTAAYHTKVLKGYELIDGERRGKRTYWVLTEKGKIAAKLIPEPLKMPTSVRTRPRRSVVPR